MFKLSTLNMTINPKIAFNICEFIVYVENLLQFSATFCGHLQGGVLRSMCYKISPTLPLLFLFLYLKIVAKIMKYLKLYTLIHTLITN